MFDTVRGLPLHPLVVHAVVVLLPLMSVITVAVAAWPKWRKAARLVVAADFVVFVAAFIARETGEQLQHRLDSLGSGTVAREHGQQGGLLPLFALALLLAAVLVWFAGRRPTLTVAAIVVAAVTAVAAIGWTVVVGESGASAVWSGVIASTRA